MDFCFCHIRKPRPCHPERRNFAACCEMTQSNPVGAREARDLRAESVPLVDPQNAASVLTFKNQQFVADF